MCNGPTASLLGKINDIRANAITIAIAYNAS